MLYNPMTCWGFSFACHHDIECHPWQKSSMQGLCLQVIHFESWRWRKRTVISGGSYQNLEGHFSLKDRCWTSKNRSNSGIQSSLIETRGQDKNVRLYFENAWGLGVSLGGSPKHLTSNGPCIFNWANWLEGGTITKLLNWNPQNALDIVVL